MQESPSKLGGLDLTCCYRMGRWSMSLWRPGTERWKMVCLVPTALHRWANSSSRDTSAYCSPVSLGS